MELGLWNSTGIINFFASVESVQKVKEHKYLIINNNWQYTFYPASMSRATGVLCYKYQYYSQDSAIKYYRCHYQMQQSNQAEQ